MINLCRKSHLAKTGPARVATDALQYIMMCFNLASVHLLLSVGRLLPSLMNNQCPQALH